MSAAAAMLNTIVLPTMLKFVNFALPYLFERSDTMSTIDYTRSQRVEPVTIVDKQASTLKYIDDVLQTLATSFTAFYLMAVQTRYNIGNVDIIRLLGPLNPDRDLSAGERRSFYNSFPAVARFGAAQTAAVQAVTGAVGMESIVRDEIQMCTQGRAEAYRFGLPTPGYVPGLESYAHDPALMASLEANLLSPFKAKPGVQVGTAAGKPDKVYPQGGMTTSGQIAEIIKDTTSLSVGKVVEVTLHDGNGKEAKVPVMIRLIASIMPSASIVQMFGDITKNITMKDRWLAWRAGQLDFIKDLIFATDIVDARIRGMANDGTGTYHEVLSRRSKNALAAVATKNPSVATASTLAILTSSTVEQLERETGGRFNDFRFRSKVFDNSYLMIVAVVNPQWETVTLYHRNIKLPTTLNLSALKSVGKGKDVDIIEVIKALQSSNAPMY